MCVGFREIANQVLFTGITKLQAQGLKVPVIAKMLGVSQDTVKDILYKGAYPSFPKALKMIVNGNMVETLQEIAELLNCAVVQLPEVNPCDPLNPKEVAKVMREVAEFFETHAQAIEDGVITEEEWKELTEKGWKAVRAILRIMMAKEER
jgi:hypothetical protein